MNGEFVAVGRRNASRRWSARFSVAALLLVACVEAFAQQATWCAKDIGLLERNASYRAASGVRTLAATLADGADYLYIGRTAPAAQARALAGGLFQMTAKEDGKKKPTVDEVDSMLDSFEMQNTMREFISAMEKGQSEPNWYFYSNSQRFLEYIRDDVGIALEAPERGALLLMDKAGEHAALHEVVQSLREKINPKLIVVHGPLPENVAFPNEGGRGPLVLKVNTRQRAFDQTTVKHLDVVKQLRNAQAADAAVIFLMPETTEAARAWQFSEERANQYATNGRRILGDLQRYGLDASVVKPTSRELAAKAISDAVASGKRLIVLVGESSDGRNIRVPGSAEVLSPEDISVRSDTMVLGLACDSQNLLRSAAGIGIIGTVYTDQLRAITRLLFDRRVPASIAEYLDIPMVTESAPAAAKVIDVVGKMAEHLTLPATGSPAVYKGLPVLFTVTPPPPPPPPPKVDTGDDGGGVGTGGGTGDTDSPPADRSRGAMFAAGVLGALTREFFRWRRLSKRNRADLYRKPQYVAISVVQMALGGAAATIFGPLVPYGWQLAVSYVCGAGLEELIRRASMLEVWTPSVPHGADAKDNGTPLEFLRA